MIWKFIKRKLGIITPCCGAEYEVYDANHLRCAECNNKFRDGAF